jgi:baculoviral IAP repeat-containing protein 6
MVRLA